jgi:bifunctional enzyme CysN/CysC
LARCRNGPPLACPAGRAPEQKSLTEAVDISDARAERPFRFPVQWVNRPNGDFRGFSGTVVSGSITPGETVLVTGSGRPARLKEIVTFEGPLDRAEAGDAVTLTFDTDVDIARGDLLADPREPPEFVDQFAAHVIWMSDQPLVPGRSYLLKIGPRTVSATVTALKHRIDVDTLARLADKTLGLNEVGFCNLSTAAPVAFDPYAASRDTGGTPRAAAAGTFYSMMNPASATR